VTFLVFSVKVLVILFKNLFNLYSYKACFLAESISVLEYIQNCDDQPIISSKTEAYYQNNDTGYYFILNYGVIVFCNTDDGYEKELIGSLTPYLKNKSSNYTDDFKAVVTKNESLKIDFETISIDRFDHQVNKMIMLHLAQSVAMDYYNTQSQRILVQVKGYTESLKLKGKVIQKPKEALRLLGEALSVKNLIAENLYILDSPDIT
jgi:uncharacterized Rmd1/YagE family protein